MRPTAVRALEVLAAAALAPLTMVLVGGGPTAGASIMASGHLQRVAAADAPAAFTVTEILSGATLKHTFTPAGSQSSSSEMLSHPDDLTRLGRDLFVGFQNGVGPQGEASSDGNTDSTIVELTLSGTPLAQWDVVGKVDGLTADPELGVLIATVNEDANSSLYTIDPARDRRPTRWSTTPTASRCPTAAAPTPSPSTVGSCSSAPRHRGRRVSLHPSRRIPLSTR